METPDFQKRAEAVYDSLGSGSTGDTMRIAAALHKVHTDALESAAQAVHHRGMAMAREQDIEHKLEKVVLLEDIEAMIRATKEDGNAR